MWWTELRHLVFVFNAVIQNFDESFFQCDVIWKALVFTESKQCLMTWRSSNICSDQSLNVSLIEKHLFCLSQNDVWWLDNQVIFFMSELLQHWHIFILSTFLASLHHRRQKTRTLEGQVHLQSQKMWGQSRRNSSHLTQNREMTCLQTKLTDQILMRLI